ncbi:MAG: DUF4345 domain-containing protein [Bacteroidia bacterium]|nr:DUF4345 domain-containing protein [Bacteroidia bacterium]
MNKSKTALQIVVGLVSAIPVIVGLQGIIGGVGRYFPGTTPDINLDSEFSFLSGAFFGYALLAWWVIKNIETAVWPFRLLTIGVFIGGLARVVSILHYGLPKTGLLISMSAELAFPLLILWQNAVVKAASKP